MLIPPPPHRISNFSPELLAYIRQRYVETDDTQDSIAAEVNISRTTLAKLAETQGWPLRKNRPLRGLPVAARLDAEATQALADVAAEAPPDPSGPEAPAVAPSLALRLEQAVERELRRVEARRAEYGNQNQRAAASDRTARTLATLTETLFKVRRLREPGPLSSDEHDDLPADADGFRRDLAQRIEVFVRSRTDASAVTANAPADGAAPAG